MSGVTTKLRALTLRLRRDASQRQIDATADLRELDEIDELIERAAQEEPTSPNRKSQEMAAVKGLAERTGAMLEEGRKP
jgi:hypothetical protein